MVQDIEKQIELIQERENTMANPEFQAWMRELNVSQSFEDRTAKIQAYDLQMQYNTKLYSKLNFNL
jgi:Fe-S cluster biosynthesis and repair protein YggX